MGGLTGWHSAAASALYKITSKPNDLAREAVSCNAGLGRKSSLVQKGFEL
jgi:hypothetical protein